MVEESVEKLREENLRLRNILYRIDRDVDRAVGRYLNSTVPHGGLTFHDFLNLLVLEIRKSTRKDFKGEAKKVLALEIRKQIDERAGSLLPLLEVGVARLITIPVLIRVKENPAVLHRRPAGMTRYQAVPLRGNTKHGRGATPKAAYLQFRESLVVGLVKASESRETMMQFLSQEREGLELEYEQAEPFKTDELHGFKVEVRLGKPML